MGHRMSIKSTKFFHSSRKNRLCTRAIKSSPISPACRTKPSYATIGSNGTSRIGTDQIIQCPTLCKITSSVWVSWRKRKPMIAFSLSDSSTKVHPVNATSFVSATLPRSENIGILCSNVTGQVDISHAKHCKTMLDLRREETKSYLVGKMLGCGVAHRTQRLVCNCATAASRDRFSCGSLLVDSIMDYRSAFVS